jgi:precorrin-6A synthase
MKHLSIIGIGTGNPEHLTIQAVTALNAAQVVFVPSKGQEKAALLEVRRTIIERYATSAPPRVVEFEIPPRRGEAEYHAGVAEWHGMLADIYQRLIDDHLSDTERGAFLVWGDPGLYDSTIRIVEQVRARGECALEYVVVPGITSVQALTASHRIPLNLIGAPVRITPARRLATDLPEDGETVVVMLDGEHAFLRLTDLDAMIYWGAYLGTSDEIVIAGRLRDVRDKIVEARAAARSRHGWIMDIYAIRRENGAH